jgi:hypothetical protein
VDGRQVAPGENGEFTSQVLIRGDLTRVEVFTINPLGEVEKEIVVLEYKEWGKLKKSMYLIAGLGYTTIDYKQSRASDFFQTGLTGKISWNYLIFPPNWDFAASAFYTVMPLSSNDPATKARFLGINGRFGYVLPSVREPWRVSILFGLYYATMFVTPGADGLYKFGFKNMSGPQLFPTVRRALKNKDAIYGYFKFSPIANSFSLLSLSSRELAMGSGYTHPLAGGKTITGSLDYANLDLTILGDNVVSNSLTIGLSYGF